jgi:hypothetical protein
MRARTTTELASPAVQSIRRSVVSIVNLLPT